MRPKALFGPRALLRWIGGVLIALAVACYAGDFLWFEYRMHNAKPNDPLEMLTVYNATVMKNGKLEVFDAQPQTQTCVHSIFPHGGYRPCWRFDRSGIQRVSAILPPRDGFREILRQNRPQDDTV